MMLQQTQVDRVLPAYRLFLKRFPTLKRLARARRGSVIKAWSGLGYNNRAVRLHTAAQAIISKHRQAVPSLLDDLRALPGVGTYTAAAIQAFAFRNHVAAVDVNHGRVLRRIFFGLGSPTVKEVQELAASLVPKGGAYRWNHGLMDFGALVCKSRPRCDICPMQTFCAAYPAVLKAPSAKRKLEPFLGSDRNVRGRIVALLRELPHGRWLPARRLQEQLDDIVPVLPERVALLVRGLQKDGVVQTRHHGNRLGAARLA